MDVSSEKKRTVKCTGPFAPWDGAYSSFKFYAESFLAWIEDKGDVYVAVLQQEGVFENYEFDASKTTFSVADLRRALAQDSDDEAGDAKKPAKGAIKIEPKTRAGTQDITSRQIQKTYNKVSRKIYRTILQTLDEVPAKKLLASDVKRGDGPGAWRVVQEIHQSGSAENKRTHLGRLIALRMASFEDFDSYNYKFTQCVDTLNFLKVPVSNDLAIACYLNGLSEDFKPVKQDVDKRDDNVTIKEVKRLAKIHYDREKSEKGDTLPDGEQKALVADGSRPRLPSISPCWTPAYTTKRGAHML